MADVADHTFALLPNFDDGLDTRYPDGNRPNPGQAVAPTMALGAVTPTSIPVTLAGGSNITALRPRLNGVLQAPISPSATSYTFSGLAPGVSYTVDFEAVGSVGVPAYSNAATRVLPPQAPTVTAASAGPSTVRFTFTGGEGATTWSATYRTPEGTGPEVVVGVDVGDGYLDVATSVGGSADLFILATNAGGSRASNLAAGIAGGASYTPFFKWSARGRTNGLPMTGNGWVNAINGTYSNEITGPFGGPVTGKLICRTRAQQGHPDGSYFGGEIVGPSVVAPAAIGTGKHLWFRVYLFFPTGYCHSFAPGGDGWGRQKFYRFDFPGDPGPRTYYDLSQISGGCGVNSNLRGGGTEGLGAPFYMSDDDAPPNLVSNGVWKAIQIHVYYHTTNGYSESWIDHEWQGRETLRRASDDAPVQLFPNAPASGFLQRIILGDYWNGGPVKQEVIYIDEILATTQTPTTLDSGGRPFISPTARELEFA